LRAVQISLRPYQLDGIARIRQAFGPDQCRAPLYVLPTGGGKTVIFSHIAHGAQAKGNRVLILTHRIELVDQISTSLANTGVEHGFIAAGYPVRPARTYVANIQTLVRRLGDTPAPDLIIIDEAHHARAATWESVIRHWPQAKLLGVTATPMRPSGEGLGTIFDKLIVGPSPLELIAGGWLVQPLVFGPETVDTSGLHTRAGEFVTSESEELVNTPAITGSALEMYRGKTDGLPALAFCVSVQHAHDVAKQFREAGYPAMALDGGTDRDIRRGVVADFRAKKIAMLSSAELFSEGFDCPGVHVGLMLRPTQSEVIYRQQCGRILRPEPGKERAWLFDHVRNWERFGLPHWDRSTPWTLEGEDRQKKKKATSVKTCPLCWAAMRSESRKCPECGHAFAPKPREVEQREGTLAEITPEEVARRQAKRRLGFEQSQAKTPEQLAEVFRKRGYKGDLLGRARHVLAARAAKKSA
jgi:DNA repair protein RadD